MSRFRSSATTDSRSRSGPARCWEPARWFCSRCPGAFTPGCTHIHLPGFINGYDQLAAKGVDKVVCVAVNDPWVMEAWVEATGAEDILMLSDGNGEFAVAMELTMDATGFGLGMRSQRYAAVIEDGAITALRVEKGAGIDVSSCLAVLGIL